MKPKPRTSPAKIPNVANLQLSPTKRTPSKSALRALPSKDSPSKRKVVFSQSETEYTDTSDAMDVDLLPLPETPSKNRKAKSPTKGGFPRLDFMETESTNSSSSLRTLDSDGLAHALKHRPLKQLDEMLLLASRTPSSAQNTPRQREKHPTGSPRKGKKVMDLDFGSPSSEDEEQRPQAAVRRRFRPVYLDQRQWESRDPRVEQMMKPAKPSKREKSERGGQPAYRYRPQLGAAEAVRFSV